MELLHASLISPTYVTRHIHKNLLDFIYRAISGTQKKTVEVPITFFPASLHFLSRPRLFQTVQFTNMMSLALLFHYLMLNMFRMLIIHPQELATYL